MTRRADRLDRLDLSVLTLTQKQPRAGAREYARLLGVARGTVQARLDKLERLDVITGHEPAVSPRGLGFTGLAYVRLNLAQGVLDQVTAGLERVPEVIEVDSVAGDSDLLCQVVSTGPENLEEVIQRILAIPGVMRSRTETVLRRRVSRRVGPLLALLDSQLPRD
ncbi:Lrp/AsnC family transcriptional regulator [Streptomyces sp. NBC_01716]|uniref:Lrp/AsnC family transcriptional regulator n=1 Tax=Streptomyces sp. NBC_01716 TaxID=2975917 RepID=UPI002E32CFA9|nr:Lrp/AsnC family transcriptional regulator [Streptomyces sp. NBC_01716]